MPDERGGAIGSNGLKDGREPQDDEPRVGVVGEFEEGRDDGMVVLVGNVLALGLAHGFRLVDQVGYFLCALIS